MLVAEASRAVRESLPYSPGAFYGASSGVALGVGLLYENLRFPALDAQRLVFKTVSGAGLVITHECDVDQSNHRPFIDGVLICPLIEFSHFVQQSSTFSNPRGFYGDLARRNIPRLLYLPPIGALAHGGVLYLNRIVSTDVSVFHRGGASLMGALSATGLRELDAALQNLLLRPKSDRLGGAPFQW